MQPVVRTGCNNIVFDTGSLRGKVGVLESRASRSTAAPESRTRRRLPHLIARQFSNLQGETRLLARTSATSRKCQKVPTAGGSRRRVARLHLGSPLAHFTMRSPRETARRSRFATLIASLPSPSTVIFNNYARLRHPSLTVHFAEMR